MVVIMVAAQGSRLYIPTYAGHLDRSYVHNDVPIRLIIPVLIN